MEEDTVVKSFILGALTGGAVVWFWGREIRELIDEKTLGVREAVGDRLEAAASGLQGTADRLQRAKETIESGLGGA
jgi:hypothetical protein